MSKNKLTLKLRRSASAVCAAFLIGVIGLAQFANAAAPTTVPLNGTIGSNTAAPTNMLYTDPNFVWGLPTDPTSAPINIGGQTVYKVASLATSATDPEGNWEDTEQLLSDGGGDSSPWTVLAANVHIDPARSDVIPAMMAMVYMSDTSLTDMFMVYCGNAAGCTTDGGTQLSAGWNVWDALVTGDWANIPDSYISEANCDGTGIWDNIQFRAINSTNTIEYYLNGKLVQSYTDPTLGNPEVETMFAYSLANFNNAMTDTSSYFTNLTMGDVVVTSDLSQTPPVCETIKPPDTGSFNAPDSYVIATGTIALIVGAASIVVAGIVVVTKRKG